MKYHTIEVGSGNYSPFDLSTTTSSSFITCHYFNEENNKLILYKLLNSNTSNNTSSTLTTSTTTTANNTTNINNNFNNNLNIIEKNKIFELDNVKKFHIIPYSTLFEERNLIICILNDNIKKFFQTTTISHISSINQNNIINNNTINNNTTINNNQTTIVTELTTTNKFILENLTNDCLLSSCNNGHFCFYSPSLHLLSIFKLSTIINTLQNTSLQNNTLQFDKMIEFDLFSKKVFSLQLTTSHVIIGQLNAMQVFDWKLQLLNNNSINSNINTSTNNNDNINFNSNSSRLIYLPKYGKITKKKIVKKDTIDNTSKNGNISLSNNSTINSDTTITKQRDEKIKEIKSLNSNSFLILSNLGNLYLLNCLMPYENDLIIKLNLPFIEKFMKITHLDIIPYLSTFSNNVINKESGNNNMEIIFGEYLLGLLFENNENIIFVKLNTNTINNTNIEILPMIENVIQHSEIIENGCFYQQSYYLFIDKKRSHFTMIEF